MPSDDLKELEKLVSQTKSGSIRGLSRLITKVENSESAAKAAVSALFSETGHAQIIGVTGPPGAGKSSLVTELALEFRKREKRVAILAVDPSSPFTGGALLGDRVRMQSLSGDKGVFIRSMASRGNLGGLARATADVIKLLDAANFDVILLETVGAGQAEVAIADLAHTTLVIEAPGMGDDVQSIKAGILEVADILVVNKADKPGASKTAKSLEMMLHLGPTGGTRHHGRIVDRPEIITAQSADAWQIPVIKTSALNQSGIADLVDQIEQHQAHLKLHGQWVERETIRLRKEIDMMLQARFQQWFAQEISSDKVNDALEQLVNRRSDPYSIVDALFQKLTQQSREIGDERTE